MGKLLVVKYGSKTVADSTGVSHERLDRHAWQLSKLAAGLIVVTSGAVMAGKAERPDIDDEQVLAGIGSANIVMAWKVAFAKYGITASQVLATDHEIDDPEEGDTLHTALLKDLGLGIVPILNTNDKLSHLELPKRRWDGENDQLAGHTAMLIGADALILITVKNGLFDNEDNPIREVMPDQHEYVSELVQGRSIGRQGITTKNEVACMAARAGIDAYMAGADEDIQSVLAGETGTHFVAAA